MSIPSFEQSGLERVAGARWLEWVDRSRPIGDPLEGASRRPGPWRVVRGPDGLQHSFACPPVSRLVAGADAGADAIALEVWEWTCATARGRLPARWAAPDREEASSWVAARPLVARNGGHLAKGELESESDRLRLVFPDVARIDAALPAARRSWLRELCLDIQSRWQLARFGIAGDRLQAEVDLSGAPEAIAKPLIENAREALVFSVERVLPALALITDPGTASVVLDRGPWWCGGESHDCVPGVAAPHPVAAG